MEKRSKPVWIMPTNDTELPDIKLFNSLTNQKDLFKPNNGKHIEWYSCGPTVYDSSHMGHARAYISIDILRRVLQNYFKFDVHYVMNITDIDDKIIKRARQNYLFSNYLKEGHDQQQILLDIDRALNHIKSKLSKESDEDKKKMLTRDINTINGILSTKSDVTSTMLNDIKDPLSDLLDKEKGSSVVDNKIFEELPRFYEQDFMDDMKNLNVLPPDDLTRVSEYIDKIIAFVAQIMSKGLAYESNGSVYFDTDKFDACDEHYYAKLVPNAYGNESLLREGEGALTNFEAGDKKSDNDFALWKASKLGEPAWDSPWGKGRPGWHIECSAMAGDKCGQQLDIHTGGIDLKFPHHDNELAQSEACFSCSQWVNYFLHTGHLTIAGCKMSKSLKNFITIKDALKQHSSRQLRLMFLLHSWKDTLDYSNDTMTAAVSFEKMLLDFFFNVEHAGKLLNRVGAPAADDSAELNEALAEARQKVFDALSDSVDTREAMFALRDLVQVGNNHFARGGAQLGQLARFVYDILLVFGAADDCGDEIGLVRYSQADLARIGGDVVAVARRFIATVASLVDDHNKARIDDLTAAFVERCRSDGLKIDLNEATVVDETISRPNLDNFLDSLAAYRQSIRAVSIENKWRQFLAECDRLRDEGLASIGVRLQDTDDEIPAVGLVPVWAVLDKKQPAKAAAPKVVAKKKIDASVEPKRMFSLGQFEGMFSLYDDDGLPTHDSAGAEVSKTKKSKFKKLLAEQQKLYDKFLSQ